MAMRNWQEVLERRLADKDAPPVLTRDLLSRLALSANNSEPVSARTLTYWKSAAVKKRKLRVVQRGVFLNYFRGKPGTLADAGFWYYPDAVVSLNMVLGDAGVLNNPTTIVTAVVPIDRRGVAPSRLGKKKTAAGSFHFFGMPRAMLNAGALTDRLDQSGRYEHLRASPEKALLDWLYLGNSARSRKTPPPHEDLDLELIDPGRLKRLAKAASMQDDVAVWLSQR